MSSIDWSVFKDFPEATCYCICGAVYSSHTKLVKTKKSFTHYSQKPCPVCNKDHDHLKRVEHEPEKWTIK